MLATLKTTQGNQINFITLKNENIEVTLLDIGAGIYSFKTKDSKDRLENIVLNYQDLDRYFDNSSYFGATVGRIAGRVADGEIILNNKKYFINKGNDKYSLHGGKKALSFKRFEFEILGENKVIFFTTQYEKDDGFPNDAKIDVIYELLENSLVISYKAQANKQSVLSLTNHSYFNLSGNFKRTIINNRLKIPADKYIETDNELIPQKISNIIEPLDFREDEILIDKLSNSYFENSTEKGLDHIFLTNKKPIILDDTENGRKLRITSSYDAMVIYTANYPDESILSNGRKMQKHDGICFEAQHTPNLSNNYDEFKGIFDSQNDYSEFIRIDCLLSSSD